MNSKRRTSDVRREIESTRRRIDRTVAKIQGRIRPAGQAEESALAELRHKPVPVALLAASAILEMVASRREEKRRGIRGFLAGLVRGRRSRRADRILAVARDLLERAAERADRMSEQLPRIQSLLHDAAAAVKPRPKPKARRGRGLVVAGALLEKAVDELSTPRRRRRTT